MPCVSVRSVCEECVPCVSVGVCEECVVCALCESRVMYCQLAYNNYTNMPYILAVQYTVPMVVLQHYIQSTGLL